MSKTPKIDQSALDRFFSTPEKDKEPRPIIAPVQAPLPASTAHRGRKADYPADAQTKRITVRLERSTWQAMRAALVSDEHDHHTQNSLVNAALRQFLGLE